MPNCSSTCGGKFKTSLRANCSYLAVAPISAWKLIALVYNSDFAVSSSKSNWAGAGVVLACVEACGPVMTWAIVGTEIQVFVAHLTTPTLLTVAGPWFGTCSVNTSRVYFAFVTKMSLPALMTSEKKGLC